MQTIILDTNFLVYLLEFKIDLFSELNRITPSGYKIKILDKTLKELKKLSEKNLYAKIALLLINKFEIIPTDSTQSVDDILVSLVIPNLIIGTQDRALKKRLNCSKLVIRQKKYLEII